jgi:hypothetical protein
VNLNKVMASHAPDPPPTDNPLPRHPSFVAFCARSPPITGTLLCRTTELTDCCRERARAANPASEDSGTSKLDHLAAVLCSAWQFAVHKSLRLSGCVPTDLAQGPMNRTTWLCPDRTNYIHPVHIAFKALKSTLNQWRNLSGADRGSVREAASV